jgi:hypothetical protein
MGTSMWLLAIIIGAVVIIAVAIWLARPRTFVIEAPVLGLLDLIPDGSPYVATDREAFGGYFASVVASRSDAPQCDVLFIYAGLRPDGMLGSTRLGLREFIRDSGAVIAVLATDTSTDHLDFAVRPKAYGQANLVLTLKRNGDEFGRFFVALFAKMKEGLSMPVAWVELAPQIPLRSAPQTEGPSLVFSCEKGQITFG